MPARKPRWNGWRLAAMLLITVPACSTGTAPSTYRVRMPTIVAPKTIACVLDGQRTECVVLLKRDHEELVRQLKAACVALGQSAKECLTEPAP